jgi:ATP synthase protein I
MDIRGKAYKIVAAQFGVAAIASGGLLVFSSGRSAWSALVGGLIAAFASLGFVGLLFPRSGQRSAKAFANALYLGEMLKLFVTAALFWVALALLDAAALPLFITYAVTLMVYWLALLPQLTGEPH